MKVARSASNNMKELFLILFFSKTVLLTPVPVNISGEVVIRPEKSLEAITPGASLQIDVSDFIGRMKIKEAGIFELEEILNKRIPEGSVTATLHGPQGEKVVLNKSGISKAKDIARLSLYADSGIPTNVAFNKIIITSNTELIGVKVYWKNFKH
jgi:hypothetical protein